MYFLGIDLGGTSIKVGIVDSDNKIVAKHSLTTDAAQGNERIVSDIALVCRECAEKAGIGFDEVSAIGIGVPGTVSRGGKVLLAPNIFMHDFDICSALSAKLEKPVFALNDANAATLAEARLGAGADFSDVVMLTYGTGVGMGIVIGGKLFEGAHGCAGEVGHMTTVFGGLPCNCGSVGCYEKYSAATALGAQTRATMRENEDSLMWDICGGDIEKAGARTPFLAAAQGDAVAASVVDSFTSHMAAGIANVCNILDPEAVIIGGGLSNEGEGLVIPVAQKVHASVMTAKSGADLPVIKRAVLGNDAGLLGAALYAKDRKNA